MPTSKNSQNTTPKIVSKQQKHSHCTSKKKSMNIVKQVSCTTNVKFSSVNLVQIGHALLNLIQNYHHTITYGLVWIDGSTHLNVGLKVISLNLMVLKLITQSPNLQRTSTKHSAGSKVKALKMRYSICALNIKKWLMNLNQKENSQCHLHVDSKTAIGMR